MSSGYEEDRLGILLVPQYGVDQALGVVLEVLSSVTR